MKAELRVFREQLNGDIRLWIGNWTLLVFIVCEAVRSSAVLWMESE